MHSFLSLYNENTVISKEYTGPLDFDVTGVDCASLTNGSPNYPDRLPNDEVIRKSCLRFEKPKCVLQLNNWNLSDKFIAMTSFMTSFDTQNF